MVSASRRVPADTVTAMRDIIRHRGPDDAGTWVSPDGMATLCNRRLAILDLSQAGHQPMASRDQTHRLTFNGEIYNYVELRDELRAAGHRFISESDTEVVLAAYAAWGPACVERFNGMFAFALWDAPARLLFAARDRFGEKPFYYTLLDDGATLLFGSEIKSLLVSGLLPAEADGPTVFRFLQEVQHDGTATTFFRGVQSLLAAHILTFHPESRTLRCTRYWDLNPAAQIRLPDDAAYGDRLLELLQDAVRLRLRSDVPVGSSLSGGLDSSTIVSLVARVSKAPRQSTFSARFDDPAVDEGPHIRALTDSLGDRIDPHETFPQPARLPEEMEALTWHQNQPVLDMSIYAQWCVMRLAREQGVTVLLDGQGGDEVLAGYHYFFAPYFLGLLRSGRWGHFLRAAPAYVRRYGVRRIPMLCSKALPVSWQERLRHRLLAHGVNADFHREHFRPPDHLPRVFSDPLKHVLYWALTRTQLPAILRYVDRNSMAFSRELRLPYLDHRLVEYLFAVPSDQHIRNARTKYVLRTATRGVIPESIRDRWDKFGFTPPEARWLRGPLHDWAGDILSSRAFAERPWTDARQIRALWQRFLAGHDGLHAVIWRWLSVELWAQVALDRQWAATGVAAPVRSAERGVSP